MFAVFRRHVSPISDLELQPGSCLTSLCQEPE
jgi:hypothetical protein